MANHCADLTGPAMTLHGRWGRRKKDMKKHFHGLFCLSHDFELDVNGGPAKGIAPALICVLEIAMPVLHLGYHAWESVKYPTEYEGLKRIIVDSATNHNFKYWCDAAEQQMEKANPPWAPRKRALLQASINALRQLGVLYYGRLEDPVPDSSDDESQEYDFPPRPFIFKPESNPQSHIPLLMPPGLGFLPAPIFPTRFKKQDIPDISSNQSHDEVQQSSVHDNEFGSAFYDEGDEGYTVCSIQP
ncbi:unnamed protein product [Calypogeia fissa]